MFELHKKRLIWIIIVSTYWTSWMTMNRIVSFDQWETRKKNKCDQDWNKELDLLEKIRSFIWLNWIELKSIDSIIIIWQMINSNKKCDQIYLWVEKKIWSMRNDLKIAFVLMSEHNWCIQLLEWISNFNQMFSIQFQIKWHLNEYKEVFIHLSRVENEDQLRCWIC